MQSTYNDQTVTSFTGLIWSFDPKEWADCRAWQFGQFLAGDSVVVQDGGQHAGELLCTR